MNGGRPLPVRSLIPNAMTLLAMCAGLTAVRLALEDRWEAAIVAMVLAIILDGLDGGVARLLNGATRFGAELDSLADLVNFGVVPALLLYFWTMQDAGRTGWIAVLLFAVCGALRLARFNVALDANAEAPPSETDPMAGRYFTGVPAPAGAGLALLPLLGWMAFGWDAFKQPHLVALWSGLVALLMVSRIPTFSVKRLRVPRQVAPAILLAVVGFGAVLASYPLITLVGVGAVYLVSLPISARRYRRELAAEIARASGKVADLKPAGRDIV